MHTRFSPYAAEPGESFVQAHAKDVVHFLSIGRAYGLSQAVAEERAIADQDLLGAIKDMKTELTLLAYGDGCETEEANIIETKPVSATMDTTPTRYMMRPESARCHSTRPTTPIWLTLSTK